MAEGWTRHLKGKSIDAWSAGIEKHGMNPLAVKAMAEEGVDISDHSSKLIDELPVHNFDYIITVCDNANESCPLFTGKTQVIHQGFDDPPKLAADCQSETEAMNHYRRVCHEIKDFVKQLPDSLL